jgi:hypothetical protein
MAVFNPVPAAARAGITRLGLDTVLDSIIAATEEFVASEQAHRSAARKGVVGIEVTDIEAQAENAHNARGLQHLNEALGHINAMNNVAQGDKERVSTWMASPEGRQALADSRQSYGRLLAEHDLATDDFQEVMSRWDTEAPQITDFGSLVTVLNQRITQVRDLRSQPNRGREAGSLPAWKIALIAGVIGASLAAVVVCFVFFACAWIMAYLAWASPSTAALINMGC